MNPLRLDGVEPGTFHWQKAGQNAYAFALGFGQAVCSPIQVRTCLLQCQEALSQINNQQDLPCVCRMQTCFELLVLFLGKWANKDWVLPGGDCTTFPIISLVNALG